jgi:hypothetical protein
MAAFLVRLWLVVVKYPLTVIFNLLFYERLRRKATPAFDAWSTAAAAGGPAAVAAAVRERVSYLADPLGGAVDFVQAPAVTWARRAGDCDDFSYLAAELFTRSGRAAWLVHYAAWNLFDSHVVCLWAERPGEFGVFDQGDLRPGFPTLQAAAAAGAPPGVKIAATVVQRYRRDGDLVGRWLGRPHRRDARERP